MEYLADRVNALGYDTAAFGKLHHFPALDKKGFNTVVNMEENRLGENEPYIKWLKKKHPEAVGWSESIDGEFLYPECDYYEHWLTDNAIDYIDDKNEDNEPFLLWLSFQGPHGPFDPPKEVRGTADVDAIPEPAAMGLEFDTPILNYRSAVSGYPKSHEQNMDLRDRYCRMIVELDNQIGRVLDRLDIHNLLDNTSIIFSADHGDMLGDHDLNTKGPYPYKAQLFIPMVIANHPDINTGSRTSALAGNIDIASTVLDMMGDDSGIGYSRSMLDMIKGINLRDVIFSEFCDSQKVVVDH